MKIILALLLFFLPYHAFIVTVMQCKYNLDTNILRFWKELVVIGLLLYVFFTTYKRHDWSLAKLYEKNTLLGLITAFVISSAIYIFFPFFELKPAAVLGFRYDVFFFFTMLIGLFAVGIQQDMRFLLRTVFIATFGILIIFLPWYVFGDISKMASHFGYSDQVSTYFANQCLSFSQNVEGHHRFQATFGGPIRMSVYFTIVGTLFAGWMLTNTRFSLRKKYIISVIFGFLLLAGIFYSYSKTSMLGVVFSAALFIFLSYKYVYRHEIGKKFYLGLTALVTTPILLVTLFKAELFLHIGAMVNRLENLSKSVEMFFYNPIGYGLGIAGPASQIGNSIESAGSWQIATSTTTTVHRFLPENWFVQILLEQGIIGFSIFMALMILIGWRLIVRLKQYRDFMTVGITTAYFALCFMSLFTHGFEEAATSYMLFLFIGIILAESMHQEKHFKQKKKK